MRLGVLLCAALLIRSADARMYQWISPKTGTMQFSGAPPSWYRAPEQAGSRVLVFENGKLVDDTAIAVAPERRRSLRREALDEVEKRTQLQALSRLERAARWRAVAAEESTESSGPDEDVPISQEQREKPTSSMPEQLEEEMLAIYEKYLQRRAAEQQDVDTTRKRTVPSHEVPQ